MDNTITPQEGTNPEVEVETTESTTAEETVETVEETPTPETKTYSETEFKQVWARAKKAEDALKKATADGSITKEALTEEQIELKILKSQGLSDDLLQELRAVAKARGKSLLDTTSDPIFVAIKNEKEAEGKAQKAKLGASKGSGTVKKEKSVSSPGLTDAEHKELWRQQLGR